MSGPRRGPRARSIANYLNDYGDGDGGGGGGGPVIPETNLFFWFDAALGTYQDTAFTTAATANNDSVRGWQDQSAQGNDLTSAAGNVLKTATLNGLPVVQVDGVHSFLFSADNVMPAFDYFLVIKNTDAAHGSVWMGSTNATYELTYLQTLPNSAVISTGGNTSIASFTDGTFGIVNAYSDGSIQGMVVNGGGAVTGPANGDFHLLGFTYSGANFIPEGQIAELIGYSAKLSDGDRATVLAYLNDKYAIF